MSASASLSIYFVDSQVIDLDTLLAGLPEEAEVYVLDSSRDGLQQMLDALGGRTGLGSIQILSHGSAGQLHLGSSLIDSNYLTAHASGFATLGSSLGADGDLLLYGCNVAQGDVGQAFISQLASLTGADVAASVDITGASTLGGDWTLEANTGSIEAETVAPAAWDGTLFSFGGYNFQTVYSGALTTSDPINAFRAGCYWDRYVLSNVANGTDVALYMGESNLDDYLQIERNGQILTEDDDSGDGERSFDAFLHWTYQAGDVIRVTSYSTAIPTGSYKLYVSVNTTVTDIGSNPPPPANVAPTFSASTFYSGNAITDTAADDSYPQLTGRLNASDSDGGTMSYSGGGAGTYGSLSVSSNGTFTFTANDAAVEGLMSSTSQSFNIAVSDGQGGSASSTISFSINGANDAIVANNDSASAYEARGASNTTAGTNPTGNVLSNDTDRDSGDSKTVSSTTGNINGNYGTLNLASNGAYTYTVNNANAAVEALKAGQSLTDSFTYTARDGAGNTSNATLTVTINGYNDNPTAVADVGTVVEGGDLVTGVVNTPNVLLNDFDGDAGETAGLTVNAYTLTGSYGTLTLTADGTYSYAVNNALAAVQALRTTANTLTDAFTYTVKDVNNTTGSASLTITIQGSNDNPFGVDDVATAIEKSGAANGTAGTNGTGNVLTNDTDVDSIANGETKTVTLVRAGGTEGSGTQVAAGTLATGVYGALTLNANGTYSYAISESNAAVQALQTGGTLIDYFNYTVSDAEGGTDVAVLAITIQGRNDAPVFDSDAASVALTDTEAYDTFANATGTVTGSDVDSAGTSFDIRGGVVSGGSSSLVGLYGTLSVVTATGAWTYQPNAIAINALPSGATTDTFQFRITDTQGLSALQTFTVTLTGANDTPLSVAIADQTYTGGTWQYQVPSTAFTDAEGSALSFTAQLVDSAGDLVGDGSLTQLTGSWLSFNATTRTFSGTPPSTDNTDIYLKVTASDGSTSASDIFKLDLSNTAPTTTDDSLSMNEGGVRVLTLADFGTYADAENDALTAIKIIAVPTDGTFEWKNGSNAWTTVISGQVITVDDIAAGKLQFTPVANANGTSYTTLTFQVSDGSDFSNTQTLTIHVNNVNNAPTGSASASLVAGTEDTVYNVSIADLLAGFSDADTLDTLSVVGLRADKGSVALNADGISYDITPIANYFGPVTLSYGVTDGTATVNGSKSFNLAGVNDTPPKLTGTLATLAAGTEDIAYTVSAADLLQGFTDVDGSPTVNVLTADHGSVVDNGNGTYTITPTPNYNGPVTLSYRVDDGQSGTNTTQTFTLAPANDAPTGNATAVLAAATEDQSYLINVADLLQGFGDVDGDALSISGLAATLNNGGASAGSLVDNGNGTYTFTPNANVNGQVNLSYAVNDGHSGTVSGALSFNITPVEDAAPNLAPPIVGAVTPNSYTDVFSTDDPLLSGFTSNVRVTVSADAGTIRLSALPSGVSSATGYTNALTGGSSIAFEGTQEAVNAALLNLQVSTPSNTSLSINASTTGMAYNADNGHYYQIGGTGSGISWTDARDAAAAATFNGLTGYLATITSSEENAFILSKLPATGWIGASDAESEGVWKWVTGPEEGTIFSNGNNSPITVVGQYANWNANEPNNSGGNEDYAQFYVGNDAGRWNDLQGTSGNGVRYYVIEFSGAPTGVVSQTFTVPVVAGGTAPVITIPENGSAVTLSETAINVAPANLGLTWTVADSEGNYNGGLLRVAVNGGGTSDETLSIQNVGTGASEIGFSAGTVTYGGVTIGTVPTTAIGGSGIGGQYLEVTLNAAATDEAITALIAALQYGNTSNTPPATRTLDIYVKDATNLLDTEQVTVTITASNDLPIASNDSITTPEDTIKVLSLADFGTYSDPDGTAIAGVKITTLESAGSLEYNSGSWTPVEPDQFISAADITAGKLRFVPAGNANGAAYATVGFQVSDGTDYSAASYTLTVNVTAVNDAPTGTAAVGMLVPGAGAAQEDTTFSLTKAQLLGNFTDTEGTALSIAGLSADNATVSTSDGGATYTFTPKAHFNGTLNLSYSVTDGTAATAATATVAVAAVNDVPALTAAQATLPGSTEDASGYTVTAAQLLQGFTDADGTTPTIAGNSVTADHGSFATSDGGETFVYTPQANYNGPVTLSYTVTDGTANVATTQTLSLTAASDAPTVANALADQAATEDAPFVFTLPANAFADVDGSSALTYSAALVDGSGNLINGGTLPDWLSFNAATATFSGTPANGDVTTAAHHIKVTASDGTATVSDIFDITVGNVNDAPVLVNPVANQVLVSDTTFSLNLAGVFSDVDVGDTLDYSVKLADGSDLPSWLVFTPGTMTLAGNPPAETPFLNLKFTATDGEVSTFTTFSLGMAQPLDAATNVNTAGVASITGTPAENSVLTAHVADADTAGTPSYQWQVSFDAGSTWTDVPGTRAQADTFTLTQAEVGSLVRVQAFFTDGGGHAESPVSPATAAIANVNDVGTVLITGNIAEGQVLTATVSDADGLTGVNIGYQWYSSSDNSTWNAISGATSNQFVTTGNEGGKYIRVVASYTDAQNTAETPLATTVSRITAGARAPVAVNDTGAATEPGGTANATPGSNATGNLLSNDIDANDGETHTVASVRLGSVEGLGTAASLDGGNFVIAGTYGTLTVNPTTGDYTYVVNNDNATVAALAAASTPLQDEFNYTNLDQTGLSDRARLTINISGANDAPVAGNNTGTATEAGGLANATPGSNATGDVLTNATDVDTGASLTITTFRTGGTEGEGTSAAAGEGLAGLYGTLTINANGTYTYVVDDANAAVQALKVGQTLAESFNYTVSDGALSDTGVLALTIQGANDAPVVSNAIFTGAAEDGGLVTGTAVTGTDVDDDAPTVFTLADTSNMNGSLTFNADGTWTYNPGFSFQTLSVGTHQDISFTYTATDSHGLVSAPATQTIRVAGANDAPIVQTNILYQQANEDAAFIFQVPISGPNQERTFFDVDANDTLTYRATLNDIDENTEDYFPLPDWLSFDTITATFTGTPPQSVLDEYLGENRQMSKVYYIRVEANDGHGGTISDFFQLTINNVNDAPVISVASVTTGAATEAGDNDAAVAVPGTSVVSGTLVYTDADDGVDLDLAATWSLTGSTAGTYGSMAINPLTGEWTYTLDNTLPATQALKEGDALTETFTARVTDNRGDYAEQLITVTVNGTNDAPVVMPGDASVTGVVTEAGHDDNGDTTAGIPTATGTFVASDVDANATKVWAVTNATGTYGSIVVVPGTGAWTYTLDNTLSATQALKEGQTVTETFTATIADDFGATALQAVTLTLTLTGSNDAPVVTNELAALAGTVIEAGHADDGTVVAGTATVSGTLSASDVDTGATRTWSIADETPSTTYGSMAIDSATGVWTYTLDNTLEATQALKEGQSVTQTYTARVTDDFGAYVDQTVTVTINGSNDAPVVTNELAALAGTVIEAGHADDGTVVAGTATVSGTLSASDVDTGATRTWSIADETPSTTYGSMAIDSATGVWTYTLDNTLEATQALKEGQSVTQTYTARVTDDFGAYVDQTVTVTINGSNDVPVVTASVQNLTFTEDVVVNAGTGANYFSFVAPFSDADTDATLTYSVTKADGSALPSWLTAAVTNTGDANIANDTITFSGKPLNSNVGAFDVKINATDDKGAVTSTTFTVTVNNVNDAPTLVRTIADVTMNENDVFSYTIPSHLNPATRIFNDIDLPYGDTLTYTAAKADGSALPSWLTFDPTTLTFSGTPQVDPDIGANDVRVTVTDSAGMSVFDVFKITVNNTNDAPSPINDALPIVSITGTVAEGQTLTANTSNLADDDGLGVLHYTWQIGSGSTWTTIGTDAATFTLTDDTLVNLANQGTQSIRVQVSYRDVRNALLPIGQAITETVTSDPVTPITLTNQAPVGSVTLTNATVANGIGAAAEDDVLTASNNLTDADGMVGSTVTYQWQRNGLDIDGATNSSYTLVQADVGSVITAVASYTDDDGFTNTVASTGTNAVININDLPVTTPISTSAIEAATTNVSLNLLTGITDEDGDTPVVSGTPTYKVNGSSEPVALPTGFTLDGTTLTVDPANSAFDYLAEGQVYTLLVEYFVTDSIGLPVSHTATITVTGTNDAPVAAVATATATEDGALVTGNVTSTDVDVLGKTASYALDAAVAGLTLNTDGSYSFDPSHADYQYLAAGEALEVVANYTVTDDEGATSRSTLTITVTGTNDAAVITGDVSASVTENNASTVTQTINGSLISTDVDNVDNSFNAVNSEVGNYGTFSMLTNGAWTYTTFDDLNGLPHTDAVETFHVTSIDGTPATVTINLINTNDAPVAVTALTNQVVVAGNSFDWEYNYQSSEESVFVDPDGDSMSFSATRADGSALPAWLHIDPATGRLYGRPAQSDVSTVVINGETFYTPVVVKITASDAFGGSTDEYLDVLVTPRTTNELPTRTGELTLTATNEDTATTIAASDLLAGFTDADLDTLTVVANSVTADHGTVVYNSGNNSYTITPALNYNGPLTLSYQVTDAFNAESVVNTTASLTVTPVNDAPVAAAKTDVATEGGALVTGSVVATDVDLDALIYSLVLGDGESAPAGLSFNADGSYSFDATNAAYNHLAVGATQVVAVSYKANDGQADSNVQTLTITVTGTNDAPVAVAKSVTATEGVITPVTGSVTASDADDGASLTYHLVGAAPAGLTFNADGTFSFDQTNSAYDYLAAGQTLDVVAQFKANDGLVDSAAQTLTITVTGSNDAPRIETALPDRTVLEDATVTLDITSFATGYGYNGRGFMDVEGSTLTYTATLANGAPLPSWISFSGTTLTASPTSNLHTTTDVRITASDGTLTVSDVLKITVTPVNDAPTGALVIIGSVAELQTLSANPSAIADGDGINGVTFSYTWQESSNGTDWTNIPGAPSTASYTLPDTLGGKQLRVVTTYTDQANYANSVASSAVTVAEVRNSYTLTEFADAPPTYGATNDVVDALAGDDVVNGGLGNDTLNGGAGADFLYGGNGTDILDGGDGNDNLFGNVGEDTLSGGLGNDVLNGGTGNDNLDGGDGNDTLSGDLGNDTLTGGLGSDTATYAAATDLVLVDLTAGTASSISLGSDTLLGIENTIGGNYGNELKGSAVDNRLDGGAGNDFLYGFDGNDGLYGGAGADFLYGGNGTDILDGGDGNDNLFGNVGEDTLSGGLGNDVLNGGTGNDNLDGGDGNDTLSGDLGNDTLTGGLGSDTFVFGNAIGATNCDTITDFVSGTDKIALSASVFTAFGLGPVALGQYLSYNQSTGELVYDADGAGAGSSAVIALVGTNNHPVLNDADFLII